jgi:sugar phosphate isomerase/epimerase
MSVLSRRRLIEMLCAAGAASPLAACQTVSSQPFFQRQKLPVGIQLYTLGELMRTDFDGTLKEVARIGYKTVELPSYMGQTPQSLRAALDKHGLKCTSAHVGMRPGTEEEPGLTGDLSKLAAHMQVIGASYVVAPILAAPADIVLTPTAEPNARGLARITTAMSEDHWKRLAAQLNGIGRTLKASGLSFGYHNHNIEFVKAGNRTGLDILIAETDPSLVAFELDVGWVAAAGADPVDVFTRHSGRFRLMHVKDIKASTTPNFDLRMDPTEVGSGRLDWTKVIPAAHKAGVREFFVEQEAPFERGRLESAAICYNFLSTLKA